MSDDDEVWKDIVVTKNGILYDYTGKYQVSNKGRIKSLLNSHGDYREKILSPGIGSSGYLQIRLCKNNERKTFSIHRLVATMFIPNPDKLPIVNHKDENRLNNNVDNLEWCTEKYNRNYGTATQRHANKIRGTKASSETRRKMSEKRVGELNPKARKVICLNTEYIFGTIKEASEWCGGDVKACCNGKTKTAGKHPQTGERLQWAWYDDYMNGNYTYIANYKSEYREPKAVVNIDTGEIFNTITEAAKKYSGHIHDCCEGKFKQAGGYHWMYYDEWLKNKNKENEEG